MLRAERLEELSSTHEPNEIRESMKLYDEMLLKKAKILANDFFWLGESMLKKNQEVDPLIETKERILHSPYMTTDFLCRILAYGLFAFFLLIGGLKICCS